jgi:hypothetical protein
VVVTTNTTTTTLGTVNAILNFMSR